MYVETQKTINEWQDQNFPSASEAGIIKHLTEEFHEFLNETFNNENRLEEAADIIIILYAWAKFNHYDLHTAIDKKMAKNRLRTWKIQPDGTGRHT